jgi:hypothetical protein
MGVLDDAIREHLDLKRRHGVAEEELRRQEEEALGPARREVAPAETDEAGNGAAAEHDTPEPELSEALPESAIRSDLHEEDVAVAESAVDEAPPRTDDTAEHGFEELDDDELRDEDEPALEEEPLEHEPLEEGAPPEAGPSAHREDPPAGHDEPLAHDDEAALDEEQLPYDDQAEDDDAPEGEDPDLLEDTPDFLQETPEHDRLWFEQKPPRDFDFD